MHIYSFYSVKYQGRWWAATVPLKSDRAKEYVEENAGSTHTYTTATSDNDVIIRWGYREEADKTMNGDHVHVWMAVMDGDSGQKKRITKRMAYQRLTSALRMCDMETVDIPYLAPLNNRQAYEKYMDKSAARDDDHTSWKDGGITSVGYLRRVVEEVGTDLYRIYRQIHKDTGLPLQKIVSQRAGIVAYLDMSKTIKTGSCNELRCFLRCFYIITDFVFIFESVPCKWIALLVGRFYPRGYS